jgi:hypothetical protein
MKQLLIILIIASASCTNQTSSETQNSKTEAEHEKPATTLSLNNGVKWKADEATLKNVAAIVQVVNDPANTVAEKRTQFYTSVQARIDTLVKECSMKGAEHEALHAWLAKVLKDVKELKENAAEFKRAHATLKQDVLSFYQYFE